MPHVPYYYIGLDLGQCADFSAFVTVEYTPGGLPHFLSPWTIPADVYRLRQLHASRSARPMVRWWTRWRASSPCRN